MRGVFSWSQTATGKQVDDVLDSLAMLAQLVQDINRTSVKIMDRRKLGL